MCYWALKKCIESAIAALVLLLTIPLLLLCATCIKLSSKGPVFHTCIRIGKKGARFKLLKLRSMKINSPPGEPVENDLRFIRLRSFRLGHWMRRLKVDELPQLFHVLSGHMALVGFRPMIPSIANQLGYVVPENALPGVVPIVFVRENQIGILERMRLERLYFEKQSLLQDLRQLLRALNYICAPKKHLESLNFASDYGGN